MSSAGQAVGGLAGAVVGFFVGGPTGAVYGAQIGIMAGGYLDPPKGPHSEVGRLNDTAQQTAAYGVEIPHGFASHAYSGNCFWIENDSLREVATDETQGAKGGGGGATVTTYTYYGTAAFSLRKLLPGQTVALRRLWLGGKLFYDAGSDDYGAIIESNARAQYFTFYNGSSSQMPDDRMQATLGAGNVPAWRGLAYIVFKDLPLEDYGNSIVGLQVKAELVDASYTATTSTLAVFEKPDPTYNFEMSVARFLPDKVIRTNLIQTVDLELISTQTQEAHYTGPAMETHRAPLPPYADSWYTSKRSIFFLQSDEDCLLIQMYDDPGSSRLVKFDSDGNTLFETGYVSTAIMPFPMMRGITDRGKTYIWDDGTKIYQVGGDTVIDSTATTYDCNFAGASENYIFAVSKAVASATIYKIDRSTLSTVATYSAAINATTMLISVESDDVFYTLANTGASNRPVYRWENGIASDTGLRYSGLFDPLNIRLHAISPSLVYVLSTNNSTYISTLYALHMAMAAGSAPLSDVIESECLRSKLLTSADIDVSSISDTVRGYQVRQAGSPRAALEPLQAVWPFDVIPSGYQIKFVPRGGSSVATIASGELDARRSGEAPGVRIERTIEMDSQLPQRVVVEYVDGDREYAAGPPGISFRKNTDTAATRNLSLSVVMTADEAAGVAEMLLRMYWIERDTVSFTAPPTRRGIEAGDVVTITDDNASFDVRLTEAEYLPDSRIRCTGRFAAAAVYSPVQLGQAGQSVSTPLTMVGDSIAVPLDVPCMVSSQNTYGYPVAMAGYLAGWPGGTLVKSDDLGQTWSAVEGFQMPASIIGFALNSITSVQTRFKDSTKTLNTNFYGDATLSSVTELQMFNGANHFAYGVDGRWEICAAQNCVQQSDGSWILSDMLHGRFGTEWAIPLHLPYDQIVLLDQNTVHFIASNLQSIGADKLLRAVTKGRRIDQASDLAFSYDAVNLTPLSPCDLNGHRHPTTGDWTISWTPRSRLAVEPFSGLATPLGESSEAYELEVWDDTYTTLKRTIGGLTSATAQYTSAFESADFGITKSALPVKVRQISSIVGRGYPLIGSLERSRSSIYDLMMFGLHGDGTNGSIVFTDYTGKTFTGYGSAQISTTIGTAFGGASIKLDGTGDYIQTPNHVSFNVGTKKMAIRARVYITGNSNTNGGGLRHATIASCWPAVAGPPISGWLFGIQGNTTTTGIGLFFESYGVGASTLHVATVSVSQNAWHWVEFDIDASGNRYLFLDGVLISGTTSHSGGGYPAVESFGNPLRIGGAALPGYAMELNGYIEEIIGINGELLNTTTHTPPAVPF